MNTAVSRRSVLVGLGAVGAFLAVDLGAVAYANKWIGSGATPKTFLDGFRAVNGPQLGFRKNHAKGVAVSGYFEANGNGQSLSRAAVFRPGQVGVIGRFSLAGGDAHAPDTPGAARGLGLTFGFPDSWQWRTAMLNLPVFPDNSSRGFYDRLLASKIVPGTGKPDPAVMDAFLRAHPETAAAMAVIKKQPPSVGFGDSTFRSLNTFYFVDESDARTPVRWSLVPQQTTAPAPRAGDANGLFDALIRQLRDGPLRWQLLVTVAEPGDPLTDATLPWPADRRTIDVGLLTLTTATTEAPGNARDDNFDPLALPDGIEPSADPLLSARSDVYAESYRQRAGEPKSPPPVQVSEVGA
ncbi:catalase family peroxidase [Mycobacterium sp. RTGN5]|uniref:catalase family peroxidase n=1 Tax=Mycobacterium sp. RTGN5 TaxID=3016522 RepID=UPI0029C8A14B|nr:catalase family peroxidase [Mycobacterium sp. RTGN5]